MTGGFPVNILNTIKAVPEVCAIYCATANPVEVIVADTGSGRGILGVIDGVKVRESKPSPTSKRGSRRSANSATADVSRPAER